MKRQVRGFGTPPPGYRVSWISGPLRLPVGWKVQVLEVSKHWSCGAQGSGAAGGQAGSTGAQARQKTLFWSAGLNARAAAPRPRSDGAAGVF